MVVGAAYFIKVFLPFDVVGPLAALTLTGYIAGATYVSLEKIISAHFKKWCLKRKYSLNQVVADKEKAKGKLSKLEKEFDEKQTKHEKKEEERKRLEKEAMKKCEELRALITTKDNLSNNDINKNKVFINKK